MVLIHAERDTRLTLIHHTQIGMTGDYQASEACLSPEGFRVLTSNANASLKVSLI